MLSFVDSIATGTFLEGFALSALHDRCTTLASTIPGVVEQGLVEQELFGLSVVIWGLIPWLSGLLEEGWRVWAGGWLR